MGFRACAGDLAKIGRSPVGDGDSPMKIGNDSLIIIRLRRPFVDQCESVPDVLPGKAAAYVRSDE